MGQKIAQATETKKIRNIYDCTVDIFLEILP